MTLKMRLLDIYGGIKLKHVWVLTILILAYIAWREPLALESLLMKMAALWIGALMGYGLDRVHFYFAKPTSHEDENSNRDMWRRTVFICVGMLAASL